MEYRTITREGIAAIVISGSKVLLLKRLPLPIITNPGIWSFIFGGRKKGESYLDAAYREIEEETGIERSDLRLLAKEMKVDLFDQRRRCMWQNRMFVFRSTTEKVRKSLENSAYRWAGIRDIRKHTNYTNIFIGEAKILHIIEGHINGK